MTKAILKFQLNDFDDKLDHFRCVKSEEMAIALFEINTARRKCNSIADDRVDKLEELDVYDGIDIVFDEILRILDKNDINLDTLIY
jgi:hypothetical protein